ncbi:MAG: 5'-methylthioadenosine/S-adenosylhomocysteine nucleosidase [Solirubrobacterales bacterium]
MAGGISKIVVLTALGLERQAMVAQLDEDSCEKQHEGTIYYVGRLPCTGDVQVAVAEVGAGNVNAGIHVERAKHVIRPDLVAFVGVAGGVKDVQPGDVVVASKIYGYESGKDGDEFLTRPVAYPLGHRIDQRVRQLITDGLWTHRLQGDEGKDEPKVVLGPVAAGDAVIDSTKSGLFRRIKQSYNDTVAVEMEGRGLFAAAHLNDSMPAVVVRGISDLIDDKDADNDERWQPIAARNAAAFAAELLCRLAGTQSPIEVGTEEELRRLRDSLSDAYYINLDRLLSDPSALDLYSGWVREGMRGARSWKELGFKEALELRHACEVAIESWAGSALGLAEALRTAEVGSRVVFDGSFRTRNWKKFDPEVGLLGDLDADPLVYTDIDERRVFMPVDPRWATTSTGRLAFTSGRIPMSGIGLLRNIDAETAHVSPYVLAPSLTGSRLRKEMFGS